MISEAGKIGGRLDDRLAGWPDVRAAVKAGLDHPFACARGNCGMSLSQLDFGTVSMLPRADSVLGPEQQAAGKTLPVALNRA